MLAVALMLLAQEDVEKSLQGAWVGERFTEGDGKGGARGEKVEFLFKDGALAGRKGNGSLIGEARYALGDKSLDATGASGGYRNKVYTGLFKLEGDTLFWCVNGTAGKDRARPTAFVADPGQAHYLIVLKRKP
jgi:uncharacterized protein (TIGR03067 family)